MSTAPPPAELANEGQRQLLEIPDSLGQIATKTGYSRAIAGAWRQGKKLPAPAARTVLERVYRIPARAWDMVPGAELDEDDDDEDDDEDDEERERGALVDYGTLAEVMAQIRDTKEALGRFGGATGGPSDSVRARQRDTLVKLLKLKASIERDEAQAEERFLRGPKWKRFMQAMRGALASHPDALDRIEEAFREIGA